MRVFSYITGIDARYTTSCPRPVERAGHSAVLRHWPQWRDKVSETRGVSDLNNRAVAITHFTSDESGHLGVLVVAQTELIRF